MMAADSDREGKYDKDCRASKNLRSMKNPFGNCVLNKKIWDGYAVYLTGKILSLKFS